MCATEGFFTKYLRKLSRVKGRIEVPQQEHVKASRMRAQVNQNQTARISVLFTVFERMKVLIDLFRGILR